MNGIYRVFYSHLDDTNEAIAFLENGKIYGVDTTHTFHGTYVTKDDCFTSNIVRASHSGHGYNMGGGGSEVAITGVVMGGKVKGEGSISGVPAKMSITLEKIRDL